MKKIAISISYVVIALIVWAAFAPSILAAKPSTLVVAIPNEPATLIPKSDQSAAAAFISSSNVLEGLVEVGRSGRLTSRLAQSWRLSEDGKVYRFKIKQGVRFHNGVRFKTSNAAAVLERIMAGTQDLNLKTLTAVRTINSSLVEAVLSEPNAIFLHRLASAQGLVTLKESKGESTFLIKGTGPFKVANWSQGDKIELINNRKYHRPGLPYLKKVIYRFIPDSQIRLAALKAGRVQVVLGYSGDPERLKSLKEDHQIKVINGVSRTKIILAFNHRTPPFNDPLVRKAVIMALDRQKIITDAMFGFGTPIGSHWSPAAPYYIDLTDLQPYDTEKAKDNLALAGIENGFLAGLKIPENNLPLKRTGLAVIKMLNNIGIEIKPIIMEKNRWQREVFEDNNFQMAVTMHSQPWDIGLYADRNNFMGYNSDKFNHAYGLALKAGSKEDEAVRFKLTQRILAQEAAAVFLFAMPTIVLARPNVMGLWRNFPEKMFKLDEVRFK